ncbi:GDSL-type esterase/lipase family protein [Lutibacter sp.]|uniref:DUF459 domain-containing protein n=1 Tax=Lutibacter sp. TaxID=1925666 RepID=UPI003567291A
MIPKLKFNKVLLIVVAIVFAIGSSNAQSYTPDKKVLYKVVEGDSLYLHVFETKQYKKPTAAIVFFFGGGWAGGHPKQFFQQSEYLSSRGILAISAEYRVRNVHRTTPFDCVEDAKSAIRWVREHAKELNVDPNKIVASGGSAGGHIAIATAIINGLENANENIEISSVPNAVVAYNPVLDTTEKGYGVKKVAGRETEISPCHQVKPNLPPMLIFHGNKDKTVPYENAERFTSLMQKAGNNCELVTVANVGHGFFNGHFFRKQGDDYFNLCMYDTDVFLKELGYLKGKPTISRKLIKIACIGDSNTQIGYPSELQNKMGAKYEVENYGKGGATIIDGSLYPYFSTSQYKASLKYNPDAALLMFGTNDANPKWCLDPNRKTDFKGTPQEEFKEGYLKLIEAFRKKNAEVKIYILNTLPVWPEKKPNHPTIKERAEQLNNWVLPLIKEIALEQNLPFINIHKLMKKGAKFSKDGVHLNEKGYKILAKKIAKEIK